MTSATTTPSRGARGRSAEGRGYGLVLFAAILLFIIGCLNLIDGIAAIANSHIFVANAHYVIANLRTWGCITLILGMLQLFAGAGVLAGSQLARWFAVAVLALNAIDQMFFIPGYPFWSLMIIALDVVALWGLCAYGSRQNLAAVSRAGSVHQRAKPGTGDVEMRFRRRTVSAAGRAADGQAGWSGPPRLAERSCCCPARPAVRVLIPPGPGHPRSVDLLLCGHHYLASQASLASIGAAAIDVTGAVAELVPVGGQRSRA